ncbi:MAG: response regulator [Patescibacteria group bacterium]|nr:response regulator [Patescibacteria group bacterium]
MDEKKKLIVLIVEDDEFLRVLTAKRLEKEGFEVAVAVDGESALTIAAKSDPSLILLDLLLPGVNGFEVLGQLKKDAELKKVPVIVFSNLGQKEDIEKAKGLGASDYLIKANFTLDDVIVKINERLKQS